MQNSHLWCAGCPVIAGTKWTATKWIHTKPYHPDWMLAPFTDKIQRPEICEVSCTAKVCLSAPFLHDLLNCLSMQQTSCHISLYPILRKSCSMPRISRFTQFYRSPALCLAGHSRDVHELGKARGV